MYARSLLRVAFALAVAVACVAFAVSCDDDDADLPDELQPTEDLPASWPDDFPLYPGAEVISALTSTEEGAAGILASFETEDAVSNVADFYESAFESGPWVNAEDPQVTDSEATFLVEREDGSSADSSVSIGEEDGSTAIFVFVTADQ
jgi:hypothetical protein